MAGAAAETWVSLRGFWYRYRVTGASRPGRPPILFLNGAFQTMESWRPFVRHFERQTATIVVDLPGVGGADLLPRRYGVDFLAESACHVLDAAGVERASVIGASYGSAVAFRLAQLFPERIAQLVLAGVMQQIPPESAARTAATIRLLRDGDMDGFATAVIDGLLCPEVECIERGRLARRVLLTQLRRLPPGDRERYIENTARLLESPGLELRTPVLAPALVFTGEHDVYTRPEYCREIAAAVPGAVMTLIERADHLFHLERLDVTLRLLDAFYRGTPVEQVGGCTPAERMTAAAAFA